MAPAILTRVRRAASAATATAPADTNTGLGGAPGNHEAPSSTHTTTILIVVIAVCGSAIMSAAIFYLFDRRKNSQFREACKRDPYLTRKEFQRRRKLSALERLEEEELQRSIMIRKSLASRTPSRSTSHLSDEEYGLGTVQQPHRMPEPPCEDKELRGPHPLQHQDQHQQLNEWSPSRARSASESSSSVSSTRQLYTEPHPGVEVEIPLPPQSRTPSPTRAPLIRKPVPPPMSAVMEDVSTRPPIPRPSDVPVHLQ